MVREAFGEVGEGQGIWVELKGMLFLSSLAHALLLVSMVLVAAYLPRREPPEFPVYTVNLVDLAGPTRKSGPKGSKKGRPSREIAQKKGEERPKEVFLPKPKEEKQETKKAELLKKPEPKKIKAEPKKVALAEKEKKERKVERVEKEEPARGTEPPVKEAKREERPIRREEEPRGEREGKAGGEGTSERPQPAVDPLVISRGSREDGGVYKGSLFLDNDFPFKLYLIQIRNKIGDNWKPVVGYLPAEGKKVIVAFKILKDGRMSDLQIEKPSGISFLDQSALRAVFNSQPFPSLPNDFNHEYLGVHFGFEYVGEG